MCSHSHRGAWTLCGQPQLGSVPAYRCGSLLLLLCVLLSLTTGCVAPKDSSTTGDTFESGGIGLTLAEWERRYNLSPIETPPPLARYMRYAERHLSVTLWTDKSTGPSIRDALISGIGFYPRSFDPEEELAEARSFLPADAVLQSTHIDASDSGGYVAIYHSKSLAARYPPLPSVPDPWKGRTPGKIVVAYARGIDGITADLQEPPIPQEPTEPPPTETPFILLPTPLPTAPIPPLPVPSEPAPPLP